MPSLGNKSKLRLIEADQRLQTICFDLIGIIDFTILEVHRSKERQNMLFKKGASKVQYPNSKHNRRPSLAMDIAPWPIPKDWGDSDPKERARFYFLAGCLMGVAEKYKIKIRWGGNWRGDGDFVKNSFDDLMHFEIVEQEEL